MLSAMDQNVSALERAFQLADSGDYSTVADIKRRLLAEGYSDAPVEGYQLNKQLRALISKAKAKHPPTGPKGQKRPADVIGAAVKVARIGTGEEDEDFADDGKDKAAQSLGRRGGRRAPRR